MVQCAIPNVAVSGPIGVDRAEADGHGRRGTACRCQCLHRVPSVAGGQTPGRGGHHRTEYSVSHWKWATLRTRRQRHYGAGDPVS